MLEFLWSGGKSAQTGAHESQAAARGAAPAPSADATQPPEAAVRQEQKCFEKNALSAESKPLLEIDQAQVAQEPDTEPEVVRAVAEAVRSRNSDEGNQRSASGSERWAVLDFRPM